MEIEILRFVAEYLAARLYHKTSKSIDTRECRVDLQKHAWYQGKFQSINLANARFIADGSNRAHAASTRACLQTGVHFVASGSDKTNSRCTCYASHEVLRTSPRFANLNGNAAVRICASRNTRVPRRNATRLARVLSASERAERERRATKRNCRHPTGCLRVGIQKRF